MDFNPNLGQWLSTIQLCSNYSFSPTHYQEQKFYETILTLTTSDWLPYFLLYLHVFNGTKLICATTLISLPIYATKSAVLSSCGSTEYSGEPIPRHIDLPKAVSSLGAKLLSQEVHFQSPPTSGALRVSPGLHLAQEASGKQPGSVPGKASTGPPFPVAATSPSPLLLFYPFPPHPTPPID